MPRLEDLMVTGGFPAPLEKLFAQIDIHESFSAGAQKCAAFFRSVEEQFPAHEFFAKLLEPTIPARWLEFALFCFLDTGAPYLQIAEQALRLKCLRRLWPCRVYRARQPVGARSFQNCITQLSVCRPGQRGRAARTSGKSLAHPHGPSAPVHQAEFLLSGRIAGPAEKRFASRCAGGNSGVSGDLAVSRILSAFFLGLIRTHGNAVGVHAGIERAARNA